jgi:hypothetical protein
MDAPPDPEPTVETLLAYLLLGGATDLDAAHEPPWIIGRAPSGIAFEVHYWPAHGYVVTRRTQPDQPTELLGIFPAWQAAADAALRA